MPLTLPIVPSQLPQGFCPADYQTMWNEYAAHGSVSIPDGSLGGISVSAGKPTDQTRPWLKLDSSGRPVRLYWFAQAAWLSFHPLLPGSTIWWFAALPNLDTFDGSDASGTISAITGRMWRQAVLPNGNTIAAQFPLVAGTLPSSQVLNPGDTGGEEKHQLIVAELPKGPIPFSVTLSADASPPSLTRLTAGNANQIQGTGSFTFDLGSDIPHNNMPPYAVGYLLQRTDRLFYAEP